jgi:hypothetical protein
MLQNFILNRENEETEERERGKEKEKEGVVKEVEAESEYITDVNICLDSILWRNHDKRSIFRSG